MLRAARHEPQRVGQTIEVNDDLGVGELAGFAQRAYPAFRAPAGEMCIRDRDAAIDAANGSPYGNGASIFTSSGRAAREFKHRVKAGMVGINVGVPATMAMFPFTGWDASCLLYTSRCV